MKVRLSQKDKIQVKGVRDISEIMQRILKRENKVSRKQERFWCIGLDETQRIKYIELFALGKFNMVNVEPVELFNLAVIKQCKLMIVVHSHPTKDTQPSPQDIEFTAYLYMAAKVLKIQLLDHLIISESSYFSFVEEGKMAEIKTKYGKS